MNISADEIARKRDLFYGAHPLVASNKFERLFHYTFCHLYNSPQALYRPLNLLTILPLVADGRPGGALHCDLKP